MNKNLYNNVFKKLLPLILLVSGSFWILGVQKISANNLQTTVRVRISGETTTTNPGGSGGGGGVSTSNARVIFSGLAYPNNKVYILKNGVVVVQTMTGPDAKFYVELNNINDGNYNFSVWSEDANSVRSLSHSFSVYITSNATTAISGILLPPTVAIDKSEVKKGEDITVFGQTVPNAIITVMVNSTSEIVDKMVAGRDGLYRYVIDSTLLTYGDHEVKTKAYVTGDELVSTYSNILAFTVGTKDVNKPSVAPGRTACPPQGDINGDCRVNLTDFSILAYWWGKNNSDSALIPIDKKLYADGKIDLRDFSIMAYYWTG
ncbi:MAG TPA: hypothetical protein PLX10_00660 [Candidatus Paceibacterota bacterium]|nr:hypothetical protein [Candidatus Paceibacterota bacterium]